MRRHLPLKSLERSSCLDTPAGAAIALLWRLPRLRLLLPASDMGTESAQLQQLAAAAKGGALTSAIHRERSHVGQPGGQRLRSKVRDPRPLPCPDGGRIYGCRDSLSAITPPRKNVIL
jgi:hypothetical protein